MKREITPRRVLPAMLALALLGGLVAPHAAFADGDKGKDGKVPIVIGTPIVTPDPTPPPPKKK